MQTPQMSESVTFVEDLKCWFVFVFFTNFGGNNVFEY